MPPFSYVFLGSAILLWGMAYWQRRSVFWSGLFVLFAALCITVGSIFLDDFINLWDERFHALVAKNMLVNPLRPSLYAHPILGEINPQWKQQLYWDNSVIWLHKQPFFLWCMALSYKIFGFSYWAGRLPAAVFSSIFGLMFYQTLRKELKDNGLVVIITGFVLLSYYSLSLVSGRQFVDQNDAIFVPLVGISTLLIWNFIANNNKYILILSAVICGAAVLTKWLPGLYPLGFLTVSLLFRKELITKLHFVGLFLLIVAIVVIPWQWYCADHYPAYFSKEMAFNAQHFWEAVEGQVRPWWFHFTQLPEHYGIGVLLLTAMGIFRAFLIKHCAYLSFAIMFIFTFVFFSLAQTRMPSFTYVSMVSVMMLATNGAVWLFDKLQGWKYLALVFMILVSFENFKPHKIYELFAGQETKQYREGMLANRKYIEGLNLTKNDIVFNLPRHSYIELMLYSSSSAYPIMPMPADLEKAKVQNVLIYSNSDTLKVHDGTHLLIGDIKHWE